MKQLFFTVCLICITAYSFAQKLPDIQNASLLAPTNVRIDGKHAEWNDTYAAENKRTELFYSVANDEKNLYLLIKSATPAIVNKIMLGGITFRINTDGKKKEKDAFSVTYPLIVRANRNQGGRNQGQNRQGGAAQGGFQNRQDQSQSQRDSATLAMRKASLATVKEIKIAGFKSIGDSLVSIYNEYGLKAVASFNQTGAFVYELAVPLALLDITIANPKEFVYQIKLNGLSNMGFGGGGGGAFAGRPGGGGGGNISMEDLTSPTDFWGKYTLAKNKQ